MMMIGSIESLKKLHTVLIDTHQGYEEAIKEASKDASSSALAPIFREMIDLRGKAHAEIHRTLLSLGEKPDDSGSFMATVHRIAIDTRALITGLNEAIPSFISGEEHVIGAYDEALEASASDAKITDILTRQKQSLQAEISKMKMLQAA
jgi:uncharacterized protein (TIGR02284 family)